VGSVGEKFDWPGYGYDFGEVKYQFEIYICNPSGSKLWDPDVNTVEL
jgi:hypothetical protein